MTEAKAVFVHVTQPIIYQLFYKGAVVGWMRLTSKVELSLDQTVWVDYAEGICENGLALKWEGLVCVL